MSGFYADPLFRSDAFFHGCSFLLHHCNDNTLALRLASNSRISKDDLHSEAAPPPRPPAAGGSLRRVGARAAGGDTLFSKSENPTSLAGSGEKALNVSASSVGEECERAPRESLLCQKFEGGSAIFPSSGHDENPCDRSPRLTPCPWHRCAGRPG